MNTDDKIVVIRCETCTYRLKYPAFFLEAKKPALRKIFKLMYRYDWQNRETIELLVSFLNVSPPILPLRSRNRVRSELLSLLSGCRNVPQTTNATS